MTDHDETLKDHEKRIRTLEDLRNPRADSVVLILTDESGERILINREYRMAMAQWIYNFPAGLIDPGEKPEESARRELVNGRGTQFDPQSVDIML